jgi:hypothetical protein
MAVKLDGNVVDAFPDQRPGRKRETSGTRRRTPRELSPGMLAHLAIERVGVAPDTPVDMLIRFRRQHADELSQFRSEVADLSSTINADLPMEELRETIRDIYQNQLQPAVNDLKSALKGRRIQAFGDGLLKISLFSASSPSVLDSSGFAAPTALLAASEISLTMTGVLYNTERQRALIESPCSYLLSLSRNLA